jgi:Domain of unknown function (DUF6894)
MPRYYFHITNGRETLENPKGMDLPGNAAAREEAVVLAKGLRHGKAQPGRSWQGWFGVDHQLESGRLLNRKIAWLCALQYFVHIAHGTARHVINVWPVSENSACTCPTPKSSRQRDPNFRRKIHDSRDAQQRLPRCHHIETVRARIRHGAERILEIAGLRISTS